MGKRVIGIMILFLMIASVYANPVLDRLIGKNDFRASPPEENGIIERFTGLFDSDRLTNGERNKIRRIRERITQSDFNDHRELYDFLNKNKAKREKLHAVCGEEFGLDPVYCFKRVSYDNPDFRKETCDLMEIEMNKRLEGKMTREKLDQYIRDHKEECELGIPQFGY